MTTQNLFDQVTLPFRRYTKRKQQPTPPLPTDIPPYAASTRANYQSRHERFGQWADSAVNSVPAERCRALLLHFLSVSLSGVGSAPDKCDILDCGCGSGRDIAQFNKSTLSIHPNSSRKPRKGKLAKCWTSGCGICGKILDEGAVITQVAVSATGFDVCKGFVDQCRGKGLAVVQADFVSFFQNIDQSRMFHGIFALASLFHLPKDELVKVLGIFHQHLHCRGILLSTIPSGNLDGIGGDGRHMLYLQYDDQVAMLQAAGFAVLFREDMSIYSGRKWILIVSRKL